MMRRTALLAMAVTAVMVAACQRDADSGRVRLEEQPGEQPGDVQPIDGRPAVVQRCDVAAPPPGVPTVQVVFSCDEVAVGIWRRLPEGTTDTLRYAVEQLLAGPTAPEREAGLSSFFSSETAGMLNEARVEGGTAYIDFRDFSRVIPNASTSAGSAELLDQIAGTVFQFDAVREAALSFEGSCDAFWNWLQRGCERLPRGGP
jgi:hypothetical protein